MSKRAVSITGSLPVVVTILTCMLGYWWYLTVTVGTLHSLVTTLQPPGTALQLYSSPDCLLSATVITHLLCFTTNTTHRVGFTHNIINTWIFLQ